MAINLLKPFKGIRVLLQGLSGGLDELDDEVGFDEAELAALEKESAENLRYIEQRSGIQTMVVDRSSEDKDRLGIKKPSKTIKREQQTQGYNKVREIEREDR